MRDIPLIVLRWAIFALLVLAGVLLLVAQVIVGERLLADVVFAAVGVVASAGMGGLIIGRRDGHPTGWLLLLIGLVVSYADGFAYLPGVSPTFADWVGSWGWTAVFALFAVLTLTFPSGHLPAGRGRWARLGRLAVRALPILVAIAALTETLGGPESSESTASPIGFLPAWLNYPALLTVVAIFLGGAISLVAKRRRTTGIERAQLTWVVFALVLLVTAVTLTFIYIFISIGVGAGDPGDSAWGPAYLVMVLFPLSFGVAVLRYRLFEIDRIVSRTVAYTLVAGLLALVFVGVVTVLSSFLPAESDVAIAGSTLAVAALFNPLRRRVQGWVDRRFNRSHYDAQVVMDGFAGSLRDEVDTDLVMAGWMEVVTATMQPEALGVWVRR
jgi:hypothetical protein